MISVQPYSEQHEQAFPIKRQERLQHYKIAPASFDTEARILDHLDRQHHVACHLAFVDGNAAGFTTWGLSFPAGKGLSLVMKELFVSKNARGHGLGKALIAALLKQEQTEGSRRSDWATDGSNLNSQAFLRKLRGAGHEKNILPY